MDKEALIDLINNNIKEGIHVVDSKGRTLLYNSNMADLEGLEIHAVLDKNLLEVLPSLEGESTLMKVLSTGEPITMNYQTYFNAQGKKISTLNSTWPIKKNGTIVGALEIARDVSNMERTANKFLYPEEYGKTYDNSTSSDCSKYTLDNILGSSPEIRNAKSIAAMASKTDSSVLIIGESGTGKELFAQSIHNASNRSKNPFIAENCAALPETLLEGLLFGTTKGGFTGAIDRPGLLQQAHGGTLLLDEINSMPLVLQAKLLRVLQESKFRPIGSNKEIEVNVRIIAIINEDPFKSIQAGKLRSDLFYRLSVVNLYIPPLRDRQGDINILKNHFIKALEKKLKKNIQIDANVESFLNSYSWPGNVRELLHVLEGAINIVENNGTIGFDHLPYYLQKNSNNDNYLKKTQISEETPSLDSLKNKNISLNEYLEELEQQFILQALKSNHLNITKAAEVLGMTRQGLQYKLKKKTLQNLMPF